MKKIIGLCFFMWISHSTYSQFITLKDANNQELLAHATIISKNPAISLTTNLKGMVDISALKNAAEIEIRMLGYKTVITNYINLSHLNFVLLLKPSELFLDEVVISGTRWKQHTNSIPAKISVISPKEVALQNPQTAADLLSISGKVYVQKSQQGGGSPMIRGFATNRLVYAVDGVRMNTAIFRGGNLQNVINLDPFAIEKTELFFGPGSVIYGSDAIGGVMSFTTRTPVFSKSKSTLISGKASARFASANTEKTAHFDINFGWKKWAITSSFSSWNFDDLRQGSHGPTDYIKSYYVERVNGGDLIVQQKNPLLQIPSAYSQVNFMQKIRWQPSETWEFQYGFHHSTTSSYGRYDRHNRIKNGTARYAEWNYGPQKWTMSNISMSHTKITAAYDQLQFRVAQQWFEESRIDRSFNKNDRNTAKEKVVALSVNLDLLKSLNSKSTLFYGAEYVSNDVTSTGSITDISNGKTRLGPSRYPAATWHSLGVYINNKYAFNARFSSQIGLRYNINSLDANFSNNATFFPFPFQKTTLNHGSLTGSLGAVYRPTNSWVFRANLASAFRSPNVDDIGKVFDSEPGSVTVPNPNLKPEYAYSVDVGAAKIFNQVLKVDLSAYYTLLKNALVRRDFQLNGQSSILYDGVLSQVQAMQNAAKATVYGLQAGLELKLNSQWQFLSDINFQKGTEELDNGATSASRHAAPFFGTSRLTYTLDQLELQVYTSYQGRRDYEDLAKEEQGKDEIYAKDNNGNNFSPAWYTLNLKTKFRLTKMWSLNLGLENITDQRYRSYSSGISAPGRNFIVSLLAIF